MDKGTKKQERIKEIKKREQSQPKQKDKETRGREGGVVIFGVFLDASRSCGQYPIFSIVLQDPERSDQMKYEH